MNTVKTKYIDLKNNENLEQLKAASEAIKKGELVIFPTETVYGVGANGLDSKAVEKIFIAKGRKSDNPLIVHISDFKMLDNIVYDVSPLEKKLSQILLQLDSTRLEFVCLATK